MNAQPFAQPLSLIILVPIFIILYVVIRQVVEQMPLFSKGSKGIVSFCVTALAVLGMDQCLVGPLLIPYATMGVVILVMLALLPLCRWYALRRHDRERRIQEKRESLIHRKD